MSGFDEQLSTITRQSFGPNGKKKILIKHHEKLYLNELAIEKPPLSVWVSNLNSEDMEGFDEQLSTITRQSFGPNGKKKILIKHHEKLYLNELAIEKPPFKCLVLAGEEQQKNFGDGVNLVVLIAQQLLQGAKELIMEGIDSPQIIQCYKEATNKVLQILETLVEGGSGLETMDVMNEDEVVLRMKAPVATKEYQMRDFLCQLIANACIKVCPKEREDFNVNNVRIFKLLGADLQDSKIFKGMALNINTVVGSIKETKKAKVLVIAGGADTTDSEQWIKQVAELGVQVMVSGASVGERAIYCCNLYQIMVLMIDSPIEFDCFCRTTHATLSKLGSTVNPDHLGYVDSISVENAARCPRVTVKNEQGDVATLLLGAHNEIVADGFERAAVNGVNTYKALCTDSRIVPGAGATEIEIARLLKEFASAETRSSYQNAILKYAQSFELIPKTLAKNAFLDVDWIIKSLYVLHNSGNVKACIDVRKGGCNDASTLKIWDLYITKYEAIKNAAEAVYKALSFSFGFGDVAIGFKVSGSGSDAISCSMVGGFVLVARAPFVDP
ncbi:TCP-1/cpn60 chaperonin family protein [Artemisia annua]|uniref:TCP-1/cpn60 chaperonin family protein n=1 Tax=Artemisia annua TaxID=35608 RepID=A0A2U1P363_ARTAN|nr:TCP-1/cpn60 chaperonin family protein [Artemisia annua]